MGEKINYNEPNSNFPVYIGKPDPNDAHYPPQSTPTSSSIGRRYSNSSVNPDTGSEIRRESANQNQRDIYFYGFLPVLYL